MDLIERYRPLMQVLATFLLASLTEALQKNRSGTVSKRLRARNTSRQGAATVVGYFSQYPLFTSKWLDFLNWRYSCSYSGKQNSRRSSQSTSYQR